MPVTIKVNGVANSLVHKGSGGISIATIPDVCKTPSPGGPVPLPYPNISQSITLAKGTTTVKADGGMMIATKGSEFSLSNGDNPGVAGGVKSSTFMKESTWITYSLDVKIEGQGACRLGDKKFQNHENTVDLGGAMQQPVSVATLVELLKRCEESRKVLEKAKNENGGKDPTYTTGTPSSGFGGEVNLQKGEITVSDKNDGCNQIQTALFETNRLAHKTDHLNADKKLKTASRDDFIKAQEKVGYNVALDSHRVVEGCKKEWGCEKTKSRYEWAADAKDFDDYFDNFLAKSHKEHFGKWWDVVNKP